VVRYALFQLPTVFLLAFPLILARRLVELPPWLVWGLVAFWVVKDVALFPFVWRSYDRERGEAPSPMVGAQGIVEDRLAPSGYVRVHGELWQGEVMGGDPPIDGGQAVRVQEVHGLTLLVRLYNDESSNQTEEG
jgi:membrane protein implicated in regulation of membrane protease activity